MNIDAGCLHYLMVREGHTFTSIMIMLEDEGRITEEACVEPVVLCKSLYNKSSLYNKLRGISLHQFCVRILESNLQRDPRSAEYMKPFLRAFFGKDTDAYIVRHILQRIASRNPVYRKDIEKIRLKEALK